VIGAVPILNGSFTWAFVAHGMKRLVIDRADSLLHSSAPRYEFDETNIKIAAATMQQPTTAYLKCMAR
jgi:hypothetical protein